MHGKWKKRIQEGTGTSVGGAFYFIRKAAAGLHGNRISKRKSERETRQLHQKRNKKWDGSYGLLQIIEI